MPASSRLSSPAMPRPHRNACAATSWSRASASPICLHRSQICATALRTAPRSGPHWTRKPWPERCRRERRSRLHAPHPIGPSLVRMSRLLQLALSACVLASVSASIACLAADSATPFTTDATDLWWNSAESGWGMQIVQSGDAAFATVYVYDAAGQPTFFVATLAEATPGRWSGDLYRGTGPY